MAPTGAVGDVGAPGRAVLGCLVAAGRVAVTGAPVGRDSGVNRRWPAPSVVLPVPVVVWASITTEGMLSPPRVVLVAPLRPLVAELVPRELAWAPEVVLDEPVDDAVDTAEPDDVLVLVPLSAPESVLVSPPPLADPPTGPAHAIGAMAPTAVPIPRATANAPTRPT
jgi:hypothetical protein